MEADYETDQLQFLATSMIEEQTSLITVNHVDLQKVAMKLFFR